MNDLAKIQFSGIIRSWYSVNKRKLPWRSTRDPYRIWLSEVILQQTRVAQGLPYYLRFLEVFPTVYDLAAAPEEEILKVWQGLGYYSRARNLHATAQMVVREFNGQFPKTSAGLITLKGIGPYTAAAIASFCYDEPVAVTDGNVFRVLARISGNDTPVNSSQGIRYFTKLSSELLDPLHPAEHNQAVMEFGALQCVPGLPDCGNCVLNTHCSAFQTGSQTVLPVKTKKQAVKKRYFNYLVVAREDKVLLHKRIDKDIWQHLYEFPLVETKSPVSAETLVQSNDFLKWLPGFEGDIMPLTQEAVVHKLSHQHIYAYFWQVNGESPESLAVPLSQIEEYPMPVLLANFVRDFDFNNGYF